MMKTEIEYELSVVSYYYVCEVCGEINYQEEYEMNNGDCFNCGTKLKKGV